MQKNLLKQFRDYFAKKEGSIKHFAIPDLWNVSAIEGIDATYTPQGQIIVDPHQFFKALIDEVYLNNAPSSIASLSHQRGQSDSGEWVRDSIIYSSLVRTSSAWDHDRSGVLEVTNRDGIKETGTFLKMLALLPFLKSMGVDALYLLPIMTFSKSHKKGDLGSPYSVQDFFALDEALHDDLSREAFSVDEEFRLLVEAAHALEMRVLIDIIPRTNAIDSHFIKDHPEWFYWIKTAEVDNYATPYIEGIENTTAPTRPYMEKVYQDKATFKHIERFDFNPKDKDLKLWESIKDSENLLESIEKNFGLSVAPAFSDHINDNQPPWSDVTFFRMFFDHPEVAKPYIKKDTPPYILFDSIKSNLHPGKKPNLELWETIANVIPYYQKTFGIDGARIDMGHALPKELLDMIVERARTQDEDFAFIAEELDNKNAKDAKDKGYNMFIGNGFFAQPRVFDGTAKQFFHKANTLALPLFAAPETHDTPRAAAREGGETLSKTLAALNMLMPNAVPFINSGLEVMEKQAMNLGLDATDRERRRLPLNDPFYGKLALFDSFQFHYLDPLRYVIPAIFKSLLPLRRELGHARFNNNAFKAIESDNPFFVALTYKLKGKVMLVFGNLNPFYPEQEYIDITLVRNNQRQRGKLRFSTHEPPRAFTQFIDMNTLDIHLGPGEVKVIEI